MDGATTAPDVIAGEASASVERPLARVPLVLNKRNFSWITERISGVGRRSRAALVVGRVCDHRADRRYSVSSVSAIKFPPASAPGV